MRLFVAVELPGELRELLGRLVAEMRNRASAKWVDEELLHITLRFIGERPEEDLERIQGALSRIRGERFMVSLGSLGGFPLGARAFRVIWVGISQGSQEMAELARSVDESLSFLGLRDERFHPHITLARAKKGRSIPREFLASFRPPEFSFKVSGFSLMQSILTPQGPIYKRLQMFRLR